MTTVVIGCGNPLRGDDGAGPATVRRLAASGLPPDVRCVDVGTDGVAAAFQMRDAAAVILIDACCSGSVPGTLHMLRGDDFGHRPATRAVSLHALRWDHVLMFGRRLCGDDLLQRITAYLIEGAHFEVGGGLSPEVDAAVGRLTDDLVAGLRAGGGLMGRGVVGGGPPTVHVVHGS